MNDSTGSMLIDRGAWETVLMLFGLGWGALTVTAIVLLASIARGK